MTQEIISLDFLCFTVNYSSETQKQRYLGQVGRLHDIKSSPVVELEAICSNYDLYNVFKRYLKF